MSGGRESADDLFRLAVPHIEYILPSSVSFDRISLSFPVFPNHGSRH